MQLYRLKEEQPLLFEKINYALHLPQYLSYLLTGTPCTDITSIGCHTNLWNFSQQHYHEWVYREGIIDKLAPILPSTSVLQTPTIPISGIGLHDSSAAMIPYFESFREPFLLISTGTWCISMNPFNDSPLTVAELQKDCLCYMSYQGSPVKASRLFAGYEHEQQVRRLADHFHRSVGYAAGVDFDPDTVESLQAREVPSPVGLGGGASVFGQRELAVFGGFERACHCVLLDIVEQQ